MEIIYLTNTQIVALYDTKEPSFKYARQLVWKGILSENGYLIESTDSILHTWNEDYFRIPISELKHP